MNLRRVAALAGVLGGGCWIARWVGGGTASWDDGAHWAGLALLGLALAGVGVGLVSSGATWLRLIVASAFPVLVWSVYSVARGEGDGLLLGAIIGVVAILLSLGGLIRARRSRQRRHAGSHAR